jgi:4-carboxymuconolactone decarboxylase
MSRVPDLDAAALSPQQRELFDAIAGTRGGVVRGPFAIWLRNEGIADAANRFGNELRLSGKLERRLFELMILTVARHWSAQYEWFAHEQSAVDAGIDRDVIEAIRNRQEPRFVRDDERLIHEVVVELLERRDLSQATYDRALAAFGLDLLIELITSTGFYVLVALMLKAFDAPVPGGARPLGDEQQES